MRPDKWQRSERLLREAGPLPFCDWLVWQLAYYWYRPSITGTTAGQWTGQGRDRRDFLWVRQGHQPDDRELARSWGVLVEPRLRAWMRRALGWKIVQAPMYSYPGHPYVYARADGILRKHSLPHRRVLLEIKTSFNGYLAHSVSPAHYIQCTLEMATARAQACLYVVWGPGGMHLFYVVFDKTLWRDTLFPRYRDEVVPERKHLSHAKAAVVRSCQDHTELVAVFRRWQKDRLRHVWLDRPRWLFSPHMQGMRSPGPQWLRALTELVDMPPEHYVAPRRDGSHRDVFTRNVRWGDAYR